MGADAAPHCGRALDAPRGQKVTVATTRVRELRVERTRGPLALIPARGRGRLWLAAVCLKHWIPAAVWVVPGPLGTVGPATAFALWRGHNRSETPGDVLNYHLSCLERDEHSINVCWVTTALCLVIQKSLGQFSHYYCYYCYYCYFRDRCLVCCPGCPQILFAQVLE